MSVDPTSRPLSGSPAQIEWAEAIRTRVGAEFDRVAASFRSIAQRQTSTKRSDTEAILAILEDKRVEVLSHERAGYFIRDWQEISDQVRQMIGKDSGYQAIRAGEAAGNIEMETASMNVRPLYDRIVVKRIDQKETTRNGIVIPDSAQEKPQEGEVVAVGRGRRLEDGNLTDLDVKVGDRILFGKYSGSETKIDGAEFLIMREEDVLGVLSATA
jgi:chaperonin GroES